MKPSAKNVPGGGAVTVPVRAVALIAPDLADDLGVTFVKVGEAFEVALDKLADVAGSDIANKAAWFWLESRRLRPQCTTPHMVTRRLLVEHHQSTGRPKKDLPEVLSALDSHTALSRVTDVLLRPAPPTIGEIQEACVPALAAITVRDNFATVTLEVSSDGWPAAIGGAPAPNEQSRWVGLEARYAPWRDRRLRRLSKVCVWADEMWVTPPGP